MSFRVRAGVAVAAVVLGGGLVAAAAGAFSGSRVDVSAAPELHPGEMMEYEAFEHLHADHVHTGDHSHADMVTVEGHSHDFTSQNDHYHSVHTGHGALWRGDVVNHHGHTHGAATACSDGVTDSWGRRAAKHHHHDGGYPGDFDGNGVGRHSHRIDCAGNSTNHRHYENGHDHPGPHDHTADLHAHSGSGKLHRHVTWTPKNDALVMRPVRGDDAGDTYTVTVPQRPAVGQTLTVWVEVDPRFIDGPAGSVAVDPARIDVTEANWQQDHTVTVTASAVARPGDWFMIRHRFSAGFTDPHIAMHERHGLLWSSIPRFDVTGRVSGAPVADDMDDALPALPEVSVASAASGGEGDPATFSLTAAPPPTSPLTVTVDVAQTGDYAAAGETGRRTVTVPVSGSAKLSVATVDDSVDEADGSISLTVVDAAGYSVGWPATLIAPVLDDDDPPQPVQEQQQAPADDETAAEEPDADPVPVCDADTALLAAVDAKIARHRDVTGRADLVAEFTAVRDALAGDATALADARAHAYRRDGANALWTQIATHLRNNCRGG